MEDSEAARIGRAVVSLLDQSPGTSSNGHSFAASTSSASRTCNPPDIDRPGRTAGGDVERLATRLRFPSSYLARRRREDSSRREGSGAAGRTVGWPKRRCSGVLYQRDVFFLPSAAQEPHLAVEGNVTPYPRGRLRDHLESLCLCRKVQFGRSWNERGLWNTPYNN